MGLSPLRAEKRQALSFSMEQTIAAEPGQSIEIGGFSRLKWSLVAQVYIGPVTETVEEYQYAFRRH